MFYQKDLRSQTEPIPINFDPYWRQLDFRELITYPDRQTEFTDWYQKNPESIPDLAAAVFTQVHYRKPLPELLTAALGYCRSMIHDQGYVSTDARTLGGESAQVHQRSHVVLVAGCQSQELLRSRARAAYDLLRNLRRLQFTVVFSGANPKASGSGVPMQTPNEALDLRSFFQGLVDGDASFETNYVTALENKAAKTRENVANFLKGNYLRRDLPATVYIVSSTFHLPKLITICEEEVAKDDSARETIEKIILVAAEDGLEQNPVVEITPYVKSMMYVVYQHLIANSPRHFWPEQNSSEAEMEEDDSSAGER